MSNAKGFEAKLVWQVCGHDPLYCGVVEGYCSGHETHVLGSYSVEARACEHAARVGGTYVLVSIINYTHFTPWQRLSAPNGRTLRLVGEDTDFTADDYAAWWAKVQVHVTPKAKRVAA